MKDKHIEISGFEVFKEKVEKGIGSSISISELMVTIDDSMLIDIAFKIMFLG